MVFQSNFLPSFSTFYPLKRGGASQRDLILLLYLGFHYREYSIGNFASFPLSGFCGSLLHVLPRLSARLASAFHPHSSRWFRSPTLHYHNPNSAVGHYAPRHDADMARTRCSTPASLWPSFQYHPNTSLSSPTASTDGTEQLTGSPPEARPLSSPQSLFPPLQPLSSTSPMLPRAQAEPNHYRPMDVLPREVFQIILQYFAPRRNASVPDSFLFSPFPLRLVESNWRSTVDCVPELWRCLDVSLGKSNHDPKIFEWYQRVTQNLTSFDSIAVRFPDKVRFIDTRLSRYLFGLVVKSKAITIKIPHLLSRECSTSRDLPDLFSHTTARENVRRQLSRGPALENLRRVEWYMTGSWFCSYFPRELDLPWSSFFALPWGILTDVKLCVKLTLHDCLTILEYASSIEKLSLRTIFPHNREVVYPEPKTHHLLHLHSLTINTEANLTMLFRSCYMPALRHLNLELEGSDAVSNLHMLDVGWWDLTRVSLGIPPCVDIVEGILTRLDAVEKLSINAKGPYVGVGTWSLKKRLPSLETFELSPDNLATDKMMAHIAQHVLTDSMQNLYAPLIHNPSIQFPFPNFLEFLRIIRLSKSISPQDFLSILSHAKHLTEGQFEISDGLVEELPPPTSQPPSPVPLLPPPTIFPTFDEDVTSNICSLKLALKLKRVSGEPLLRALTLPRLVKFEFEASRNSSACDEFYRLLERSQCPLVHLSLKCHSAHSHVVLRVLRLVSRSLRWLEVVNSSVVSAGDSRHCFGKELFDPLAHSDDYDDDDDDCFVHPESSQPTTPTSPRRPCRLLCPHLEHLHIWPCTDLTSFRKMVSSRWTTTTTTTTAHRHCCQCKKLEFVGAGFLPGDDWTEFVKELKERRIRTEFERLAEDSVLYPACDLV
ncbi:hypothetical protein Agabi119p4_2763 [Agaricus bisporus var. burnettii]|uniref:F-box domain-containing protein n=1 Tax=Agaricus bisporus var. burnettii TaxID=192524 RepID=A0A8H7KII9_AGABI|nr:hypothetical protein Agabi119p4_2763 [Agaricus bisporus var. burnettii]